MANHESEVDSSSEVSWPIRRATQVGLALVGALLLREAVESVRAQTDQACGIDSSAIMQEAYEEQGLQGMAVGVKDASDPRIYFSDSEPFAATREAMLHHPGAAATGAWNGMWRLAGADFSCKAGALLEE